MNFAAFSEYCYFQSSFSVEKLYADVLDSVQSLGPDLRTAIARVKSNSGYSQRLQDSMSALSWVFLRSYGISKEVFVLQRSHCF